MISRLRLTTAARHNDGSDRQGNVFNLLVVAMRDEWIMLYNLAFLMYSDFY
jgi:hypothetical protein